MISGFNTDIDFDGVTYHVQTEDKGLETPLILSLVYTRGEILAAKRSPYDDLIKAGFDEKVLAERLQRQHRLICAAVKQGRIEDLKRMTMREPAAAAPPVAEPKKISKTITLPAQEIESDPLELEPFLDIPIALVETTNGAEILPEPPLDVAAHSARVLRAGAEETVADFARAEAVGSTALNLILLDEREFRGGDRATLRFQVTQGGGTNERDIEGAEITVKVLGAAFRPVILHAKTAADGIANVHLQLPSFRTGRAAILIKAAHGGYEAELRRIVTQG